MNLKRSLSKKQTLLVIYNNKTYQIKIMDNLKALTKSRLGYISLNKSSSSFNKLIKKQGIDPKRVLFVDAISAMKKKVPYQDDYGYYVKSPNDLKGLMKFIEKLVRHEYKNMVFDSITDLSGYKQKKDIVNFVSRAVRAIKKGETKAIFFADVNSEFVFDIKDFFDGVLELK